MGALSARCSRASSRRASPASRTSRLADMGCIAAPIGLFFGRCANFVNGELWGAPTERALGRGVRRYGGHDAASSLAALRGPARGRRVVLRAVSSCRASNRRVRSGTFLGVFLVGLRPVPLPYRVRSPARCADRLPVGRVVDYGPASSACRSWWREHVPLFMPFALRNRKKGFQK